MAIVTTDLETIYNEFLTKGIEQLAQLQKDTQMEDEQFASASSSVIIGAMANSAKALEVLKRNELMDKQIQTEVNKALDVISSTAVRDAQSAQDIINKQAQKILIDKQVLKLVEDTLFTAQQKAELIRSVDFNNKIKALDSYADMIGTMGAGGLIVSSNMWSTLFKMINDLNNAATIPESTTVVKA